VAPLCGFVLDQGALFEGQIIDSIVLFERSAQFFQACLLDRDNADLQAWLDRAKLFSGHRRRLRDLQQPSIWLCWNFGAIYTSSQIQPLCCCGRRHIICP